MKNLITIILLSFSNLAVAQEMLELTEARIARIDNMSEIEFASLSKVEEECLRNGSPLAIARISNYPDSLDIIYELSLEGEDIGLPRDLDRHCSQIHRVYAAVLTRQEGVVGQDWTEVDALSRIEVMVLSKFIGYCGLKDQLIRFQDTTRMPGGNDFVNRFLSTEATRLGWDYDELNRRCATQTQIYNLITYRLEEMEKD